MIENKINTHLPNKLRLLFGILILFFTFIYSLISLVNHYYFRTYALDLGLYTSALYDYSHLQFNDSTVMQENRENLLTAHFDLFLIIVSPLSWLLNSYTLLIVQISSIIMGGIGVFKYFQTSELNFKNRISFFAMTYFFLCWGVYAALAYDYHSNVIAAMAVPWFFYFFKTKKIGYSFLTLVLIIINKENMALWMPFVCIGMMVEYKADKKMLAYLCLFAIFSFLSFALIIGLIMPLMNNEPYPFNYSVLGNDWFDAIKNCFTHPIHFFKSWFVNHTDDSGGDYVKMEMYLFFLLSGGVVLFFAPQYLFMLIPIFAQKVFYNNIGTWGVHGQYSIEFVPILTIGIFYVVGKISNGKFQLMMGAICVIMALLVTIRLMDKTVGWTDTARSRFYNACHYQNNYDVSEVHQALDKIPENAAVSCQSSFLPHLSVRDNIFQFPILLNAEYIVFSINENPYPLSSEDFKKQTDSLMLSNDWQVFYKSNHLRILKKVR